MTVFRSHPSVSAKLLDDEQILVHLDTGFCFALEGVGVRIWQLLENGATADGIVDSLVSEYEVARERVAVDVDTLLAELKQYELVVEEP